MWQCVLLCMMLHLQRLDGAPCTTQRPMCARHPSQYEAGRPARSNNLQMQRLGPRTHSCSHLPLPVQLVAGLLPVLAHASCKSGVSIRGIVFRATDMRASNSSKPLV